MRSNRRAWSRKRVLAASGGPEEAAFKDAPLLLGTAERERIAGVHAGIAEQEVARALVAAGARFPNHLDAAPRGTGIGPPPMLWR